MHTVQRIVTLGSFLFFSSTFLSAITQDPRAPVSPPSTSIAAQSTPRQDSSSQKKSKHSDDFLIRGSVFSPEGLSLPGAEIRIRRDAETKFRWHTQTNSRGEFAIRVKQGSAYQLVVQMKGLKEQARPVDAKSGGNLEELSIRMEREGGAKQ